jgi:hypothetical protein
MDHLPFWYGSKVPNLTFLKKAISEIKIVDVPANTISSNNNELFIINLATVRAGK